MVGNGAPDMARQLPVSEEDAVEGCVVYFEAVRDELQPDAGTLGHRAFLRQQALSLGDTKLVYDEGSGRPDDLFAAAEVGDADADAVIKDLAREVVEAGGSLPPRLAAYVVNVMDSHVPARRGPTPGRFRLRDQHVFHLVLALTSTRFGFPATRNAATEAASATSLVSLALKRLGIRLSEQQIADIVRRHMAEVEDL
jgi:hypothetical protein